METVVPGLRWEVMGDAFLPGSPDHRVPDGTRVAANDPCHERRVAVGIPGRADTVGGSGDGGAGLSGLERGPKWAQRLGA